MNRERAERNMTMFEMSFENFGNLEMVLDYLRSEERNYEENPNEHHIWLNIKPHAREWVEAEREKRHLGR
jgi:hypothetical protein